MAVPYINFCDQRYSGDSLVCVNCSKMYLPIKCTNRSLFFTSILHWLVTCTNRYNVLSEHVISDLQCINLLSRTAFRHGVRHKVVLALVSGRASLCKRGVVILAGITTAAKEKRKGVSGGRSEAWRRQAVNNVSTK